MPKRIAFQPHDRCQPCHHRLSPEILPMSFPFFEVKICISVSDAAWRAEGGGRRSFSIAPGRSAWRGGRPGAGRSLTGAAIIGRWSRPAAWPADITAQRPAHRQPALRADAQDSWSPDRGGIFQDPLTSLNPLLHRRTATGRDDPDASGAERHRRARPCHQAALEEVGIPAARERMIIIRTSSPAACGGGGHRARAGHEPK